VPLETLTGDNLSTLLKLAEQRIGADALILHTRRIKGPGGPTFEIVAADPATAAKRQAGRTPGGREAAAPARPGSGPLVLALIGPTGAGKTTTIAKLATHPRVFAGKRVGLLTLDTFKIGGVEQLQRIAEIGGMPFAAVYLDEDVAPAKALLAGCDVWLIDTPGRGPAQRRDREAVAELLKAFAPHEVHLVLPAALPVHLCAAALRDGVRFGVTHLLATKLDEAPDETAVVDLAASRDVPMRWTSSGQEVPFDLASAADALDASKLSQSRVPAGGVG